MTALGRLATSLLEASALTALVAVPLFFDPFSVRVFEPERAALLRAIAAMAVACGAVRVLAATRRTRDGGAWVAPRLTGWGPLAVAVGAFALATSITTVTAIAPRLSLWGSYVRMQGAATTASWVVVFAALVVTLRRPAQVERARLALVLAAIPCALYALLQWYGIDPQRWDQHVATRPVGTQGNAIFLGAYLCMVLPLVYDAALEAWERARPLPAGLWLGIGGLTALALIASASRGPLLAALVATGFWIMLELHARGRRRGVLLVVATALAGVALLVLFQVAAGTRRTSMGWERLAALVDPHTESSQVRILIWEGVADLVAPHPPLAFPDGQRDPLGALRPLVGYGPESLLVTFSRFYPPALGSLEDREKIPDRAHNAVWDALATGGVLGVAAQLALYLAAFHVVFAHLGLASGARSFRRLLGCTGVGVALATPAAVLLGGAGFFGPGIGLGLVGGLFAYVATMVRRGSPPPAERHVLVAGLAAALVAHLVETQVGIETVSSGLAFWACLALLAAIGRCRPAPTGADTGPRTDARAIAGGIMLTLALVTPTFGLLDNADLRTAVWPIVRGAVGNGLGILLFGSWALGAPLLAVACPRPRSAFVVNTALAAVVTAGWIGWQAHALAELARAAPDSVAALLENARTIEWVPLRFHVLGLVLLVALGVAVAWSEDPAPLATSDDMPVPSRLAALALVFLGLVVVEQGVLRPLRADLALKSAEYLVDRARWTEAGVFFARALGLAPDEPQYWSMAARGRHEEAKTVAEPERRDVLMLDAIEYAREAHRLEPLHGGHLANLGRITFWWASVTKDPALRTLRAAEADAYLARALAAMPYHPRLWTERAALAAEIRGRTDLACDYAAHAVALDAGYEPARLLLQELDCSGAAPPSTPAS